MTGPILIVEDRAHEPEGHYPVLFAALAATWREMGVDTVTLTARGWALDGDPALSPLRQLRFGRFALAVSTFAEWMNRRKFGRIGLLLRDVCRSASIVGAARKARRRIGAGGVVVVSRNAHPLFVSLFADRAPWIVFRFDQPSAWMQSRVVRPIVSASHFRNDRLRHEGGGVSVLVNNPRALSEWQRFAPWLRPEQILFTFARVGEHGAGRRPLGLPDRDRLALVFGSRHGGKDLITVFEAFRELPEWRLVVAGAGASDAYREWAAANGPISPAPVVFDGYVDVETRTSLFSSVDAVLLSFRAGHQQDSGTLVDAISAGTPVVMSEGPEAELVRRLRIGEIFDPGSVDSLRDALRGLEAPDASAVLAAQDAISPRRTASRISAILEGTPRIAEAR